MNEHAIQYVANMGVSDAARAVQNDKSLAPHVRTLRFINEMFSSSPQNTWKDDSMVDGHLSDFLVVYSLISIVVNSMEEASASLPPNSDRALVVQTAFENALILFWKQMEAKQMTGVRTIGSEKRIQRLDFEFPYSIYGDLSNIKAQIIAFLNRDTNGLGRRDEIVRWVSLLLRAILCPVATRFDRDHPIINVSYALFFYRIEWVIKNRKTYAKWAEMMFEQHISPFWKAHKASRAAASSAMLSTSVKKDKDVVMDMIDDTIKSIKSALEFQNEDDFVFKEKKRRSKKASKTGSERPIDSKAKRARVDTTHDMPEIMPTPVSTTSTTSSNTSHISPFWSGGDPYSSLIDVDKYSSDQDRMMLYWLFCSYNYDKFLEFLKSEIDDSTPQMYIDQHMAHANVLFDGDARRVESLRGILQKGNVVSESLQNIKSHTIAPAESMQNAEPPAVGATEYISNEDLGDYLDFSYDDGSYLDESQWA